MRKLPAFVAASALAVSLAACTSNGPASIDGCTPVAGPGGASSIVDVTGAAGAAPTVDLPTPLVSNGLQRSTVVRGEGEPIEAGSQLLFDVTILLGATGEPLAATSYDGASVARGAAGHEGSLSVVLSCARVGERLVATGPAAQLVGEGTYASAGIEDDETLVIVYDVIGSYLGKANGFNQLPVDGMPTVVTAVGGQPGIMLPDSAPPSELQLATIKLGFGDAVAEGDTVVLHYAIFNWPDNGAAASPLQSTWDSGLAALLEADPETLPEGILKTIVGSTVGSQVMSIIPANEETGESARVVIVDILGIAAE